MRSPTFPAADHVVALGDEVGSTREAEVRKGFTKTDHERFDVVVAAAWRMQRVLQEHVGGGQLVDDSEIASRAPEIREPAANVVVFFAHDPSLLLAAAS